MGDLGVIFAILCVEQLKTLISSRKRKLPTSSGMKKEIHPADYRQVIFDDATSGKRFLIGSTVKTAKTAKLDGKEYPVFNVEISSASHPFYTGQSKTIDTAGRVEKFKTRAASAKPKAGKKTKSAKGGSASGGK
ncbi:MAG: 50S ribosomal protein L31 type B [Candidatus Kaiserbacteria bacterium GW2011_GWA2_49_19]|uniref:Large ribosomal subunit protein bL31B n=2 Tax=Candidatus Kaiseribacteriota TaxID=1752734 RepID=A0A0G1VNY8_9BACT|nr:MAG: 50S ribosomal protein L31 type B [Candidatus Kaiserbacteria bacterium GW2011_GWA2_49_19]